MDQQTYETFRTIMIIALILFGVFAAFVGWACLVVGARADRLSERIVEAMKRDDPRPYDADRHNVAGGRVGK